MVNSFRRRLPSGVPTSANRLFALSSEPKNGGSPQEMIDCGRSLVGVRTLQQPNSVLRVRFSVELISYLCSICYSNTPALGLSFGPLLISRAAVPETRSRHTTGALRSRRVIKIVSQLTSREATWLLRGPRPRPQKATKPGAGWAAVRPARAPPTEPPAPLAARPAAPGAPSQAERRPAGELPAQSAESGLAPRRSTESAPAAHPRADPATARRILRTLPGAPERLGGLRNRGDSPEKR